MNGTNRIWGFKLASLTPFTSEHSENEANTITPADKLAEQGFTVYNSCTLITPFIYIDIKHKKWAVSKDQISDPKIYDFSDVQDCEITMICGSETTTST